MATDILQLITRMRVMAWAIDRFSARKRPCASAPSTGDAETMADETPHDLSHCLESLFASADHVDASPAHLRLMYGTSPDE